MLILCRELQWAAIVPKAFHFHVLRSRLQTLQNFRAMQSYGKLCPVPIAPRLPGVGAVEGGLESRGGVEGASQCHGAFLIFSHSIAIAQICSCGDRVLGGAWDLYNCSRFCVCLSVWLSGCLSVSLSLCVSLSLSVRLSVRPSVRLSVMSVYLSLCVCVHVRISYSILESYSLKWC